MQSADSASDDDATTSEALFVYHSNNDVNVGDHIRIQANAGEYKNQTQLTSVSDIIVCATEAPLPAATAVSLPMSEESREALEGMLVSFEQDLFVTDTYNYGRYGQVGLATERLYNPTQVTTPGEAANALSAENQTKSIKLDDLSSAQNPSSLPYPAPEMTPENTLRSGDTVKSIAAVFGYPFGSWTLLPTDQVNVMQTNPRTPAPTFEQEGNLRVASFNVLNYFNGDGQGAGFPTSRGADSAEEFVRQRDKIVTAIAQLDADIVGLMEIENDGYDDISAIADLVRGLNDIAGEGTYAYVTPNQADMGTDDIAVGLVYRPAVVTPSGASAVLNSSNSIKDDSNNPLFLDSKNRPVLTQAFTLLENDESLAIAVTHFKSKGSNCDSLGDPDIGDGQGNCNVTRTNAAKALGSFLTQQYGDMATIAVGDFNAYAKEDPITTLADAGYGNIFDGLEKTGTYSYIFGGELGQLDHALANPAMMSAILDAEFWALNADEPRILDYNVEFQDAAQQAKFYAPDAFRSSDHDPVVVEINLVGEYLLGDFDTDNDVDRVDVGIFYQKLRQGQIEDMSYDFNNDGALNTRDVRGLMQLCTRARCATE